MKKRSEHLSSHGNCSALSQTEEEHSFNCAGDSGGHLCTPGRTDVPPTTAGSPFIIRRWERIHYQQFLRVTFKLFILFIQLQAITEMRYLEWHLLRIRGREGGVSLEMHVTAALSQSTGATSVTLRRSMPARMLPRTRFAARLGNEMGAHRTTYGESLRFSGRNLSGAGFIRPTSAAGRTPSRRKVLVRKGERSGACPTEGSVREGGRTATAEINPGITERSAAKLGQWPVCQSGGYRYRPMPNGYLTPQSGYVCCARIRFFFQRK